MKHSNLITSGIEKALSSIAFHRDGPFRRFELFQTDHITCNGGMRIVTHLINDLPSIIPSYCDAHQHDFDEINLIIGNEGDLKYRIRLDDEEFIVNSPSTVYIPGGVKHSAEVVDGKGVFVAIMFAEKYVAK